MLSQIYSIMINSPFTNTTILKYFLELFFLQTFSINQTSGIVKTGNNSYKLKTEIRQILYLLYQHNKITKKLCNILIKSL